MSALARLNAALQRSPGLAMWAALVLGALHSLPMAFSALWPLQLLALAGAVHLLHHATPRAAFAQGWAFGLGWLTAAVWWLFISMHRYGGLPAWLAALAVLALCGVLSLYLGGAFFTFARRQRRQAGRDALLFAALWLLAEWARAWLFTGFPWAASGYAHVDSPLAVLAPWVGVYGMGAVAAALAAWLALSAQRLAITVGAALVLGAMAWFGPAQFAQPTGALSVSLLQGNVPQDEKFSMDHLASNLAWTVDQLVTAPGDLVVAPETVIPLLPEQLDPADWQPLVKHFQRGPQALLLGMPLGDSQVGYTNSVVGLSANTRAAPEGRYRYDKHHLVPFGEFIPTGFRWFTQLMNIPLGDFNRGPQGAPTFDFRGERLAPNICYEDLYGEELATGFTDAATAPTVLVNVSNIGWFGETIAVPQHLAISRLRTLELQRPMLRATNTGATAIIDASGRVTHALAPHTQGVLQGEVTGRRGLTPYARWAGRWGLWPLLGWALALIGGLGLGAERARAFGRPGARR
ncbi:MAG: hypothetical protein RJA98_3104 [Pseudomonadota bacterium]